jgi:hypothetical protein
MQSARIQSVKKIGVRSMRYRYCPLYALPSRRQQ